MGFTFNKTIIKFKKVYAKIVWLSFHIVILNATQISMTSTNDFHKPLHNYFDFTTFK